MLFNQQSSSLFKLCPSDSTGPGGSDSTTGLADGLKSDETTKSHEQNQQELSFLENILAEEDPEFIKNLSGFEKQITMDISNATDPNDLILDDSALSLAIGQAGHKGPTFFAQIFYTFKQPFLIKKHPKQVLLFWFALALSGYGLVSLKKSKIWTYQSKLFFTSFADLGLPTHDYDLLSDVEPFFDNIRFSKNIMSLVKMTANLKTSENSSDNPMMAFEVVIQGLSNDAIVEIKDREAEFRDLILREAEEFSYDELDSTQGKQRLSDLILNKINANLTQGQIRKVFYGNIIIKP